MTSRDTYNTSCKNAETTKIAQGLIDVVSEQVTRDASASVVGYNLVNGNFSNLDSSTRSANEKRFLNALAREKTKQASIAAARDTLRNAGGDSAAF